MKPSAKQQWRGLHRWIFISLQDPFALNIVQDLKKRGFHIDVEKLKATLAKLRAWRRDEAQAFRDKLFRKAKALRQAAIAQLVPPAVQKKAQRKERAAVIMREHAALAAKLKRRGEPNPRTQAWEKLAKRWGHASGPALKKWKNWVYRVTGTKMS